MEDTLRDKNFRLKVKGVDVLILVLMEDTLRAKNFSASKPYVSLNPCFNGRYSQRGTKSFQNIKSELVLILVLMEDTLRVVVSETKSSNPLCLNPCFNGRYSQSCPKFFEDEDNVQS